MTTTHLSFPGGERAHVFVSWLHPFKEQKLVVIGSEAMAVFDDGEPWERKLLLFPHRIKWTDGMPTPHKAEAAAVFARPERAIAGRVPAFSRLRRDRRHPAHRWARGLARAKRADTRVGAPAQPGGRARSRSRPSPTIDGRRVFPAPGFTNRPMSTTASKSATTHPSGTSATFSAQSRSVRTA